MGLKFLEVEIQCGKEHEIQQPYGGQKFKSGIVFDYIDAIRTDDYAADNQSDDTWNVQFVEQYGHYENNQKYYGEQQYGIRYGH